MNAICITKYHAYLVGFISTKSIVFTKSTETSLNKLINLIKMIISRDEVLISHPFSLMTVIFFSFKKIILLDDGLAYYYKSPAPSNLTGYFYRVIILITHGVWVRSFLDLIHLKNVQSCYLVAPEYLFTDSRPIKIPIKKININTGFIKEKYANGLVLDQAGYTIKYANKFSNFLSKESVNRNIDFEILKHPASTYSLISQVSNFNVIVQYSDLVDLLKNYEPTYIVGYPSTGLLLVKLLFPESNVVCMFSKEDENLLLELINMFQELEIKIKYI